MVKANTDSNSIGKTEFSDFLHNGDDEDDANISFLSVSPLVENNPIKSCPWRESAWWIRKHTHICFSRNKQTNRETINAKYEHTNIPTVLQNKTSKAENKHSNKHTD